MKFFRNPIFLISFLFIILSVVFFGQSSNFLVDFSREISVPYQMTNGEKLIKDIFLIYGFWGYFVNFLIFKITSNTEILLILANFLSYFILILFYFILKKFVSEKTALFFSVAFIFASIFSCATFSFVVPYSFSVLWGYLGCYLTLFSLLYKKEALLYLSLGLIFVSKVELFILVFLFVLFFKISKKEKFSPKFLAIFVFPLIYLSYILLNSINIDDILFNFETIKKMTKTEALAYFYKGMGVFFEIKYFLFNIKNFSYYVLCFIFSYFIYIKNKKILSILLLIAFFAIFDTVFVLNLSVFLMIGLFIFSFLKKKIDEKDVILFSFALIMSSKSLFALNVFGYGNFSFLIVIFNIYLLLTKFLDKNYLKTHFFIFLLFVSGINLLNLKMDYKFKIKTQKGAIYLKQKDFEIFKSTMEFIKKNINENESLVVLPENQILNFIYNKNWNFYNTTFTPLDFETFGDKYFIDNIEKNKTDYVVFYPRDTKDYKKKLICYDYGVDFCSYIADNYIRIKIINDKVTIFKRKYEN